MKNAYKGERAMKTDTWIVGKLGNRPSSDLVAQEARSFGRVYFDALVSERAA